jgi:hypothetical protein
LDEWRRRESNPRKISIGVSLVRREAAPSFETPSSFSTPRR